MNLGILSIYKLKTDALLNTPTSTIERPSLSKATTKQRLDNTTKPDSIYYQSGQQVQSMADACQSSRNILAKINIE